VLGRDERDERKFRVATRRSGISACIAVVIKLSRLNMDVLLYDIRA